MAETTLNQSAQFGFLGESVDHVLGWGGGAAVNIMVYFLMRQLTVQVLRTGKGGGGCHWTRTV